MKVRPQAAAVVQPESHRQFLQPASEAARHAKPDVVRFGAQSYPEFFQRATLTPAQAAVADQIGQIAEAQSAKAIPQALALLREPDYALLAAGRGRHPFQTPLTHLFEHLPGFRTRRQLIGGLLDMAMQSSHPQTAENAMLALCDIYFQNLRPDAAVPPGRAQRVGSQPAAAAKPGVLRQGLNQLLRRQLLHGVDELLSSTSNRPEHVRHLQEAVRLQWLRWAWSRTWEPQANFGDAETAAINRDWQPMMNRHLPNTPHNRVSPMLQQELKLALVDHDPQAFRKLSEKGILAQLIPDWARLTGPDNVQHPHQHYSLLEHSLRVVEGTRQSPWFQHLSTSQQQMTTLAALYHDIGKQAGPANLQPLLAPDRVHPLRSMFVAQRSMPRLGLSKTEEDCIARLVLHHQVLGNLAVYGRFSAAKGTWDQSVAQAAVMLETPETVRMLKALTEGDIRSVKRDEQWFSPEIQARLDAVSREVEQMTATAVHTGQANLPPHSRDPLARVWHARMKHEGSNLVTASLPEMLRKFGASGKATGYSVAEDIQVMRLHANDRQTFLTLPAEVLQSHLGQDNLFDRPLYALNEWQADDFAAQADRYGLIVNVEPQHVAAQTSKELLDLLPDEVLDTPQALRQLISGQIEDPRLNLLHTAREDGRTPMSPGEHSMLVAAKPHLTGIYYRQSRPEDPIMLPPALQRLMREQHLPLLVV